MNLYFRLICLVFKLFRIETKVPLEPSRLKFRVYPFDCDFQGHMTNARYLGIMDIGRIHLLGQYGILGRLLKQKWFPVVSSAAVTYVRSIDLWHSYELVSRIVAWDERFFYLEQRFESEGKLLATGWIKAAFLSKERLITPKEVIGVSGIEIESPEPPDTVVKWKEFLMSKKKDS